ncbi:histidine kinase [Streptomyces sp. NPDC051214]|uniref:histidine kinase n=1 Tax=Streptomyces sp. NPDC051214 TaxID=3155282 RepID=UPI00342F2DE9
MADALSPCGTSARTYAVLVAEPEASVRGMLASAIEATSGLRVVGEAVNGEDAVARAAETHPDVVVLGAGAPGMNLVTTTRQLMESGDAPKIVILADPDQQERCRGALRAGASGLFPRSGHPERLLGAIPAIVAGYVLMAPAVALQMMGKYAGDPHPGRDRPCVGAFPQPDREAMRVSIPLDQRLFARDVHDVLGRTLGAINRKGELVAQLLRTQPERALAELETVLVLARRSMGEVRALAGGYRIGDLTTEIEGVRSDLGLMGVCVEVSRSSATLPRPIQEAFGWVAREAAANIIHHSEAGHCSIEVWTSDRTAHLRITNDGAGQHSSTPGTGLAGLTARLRAVGGTLSHGPGTDLTYRVEATTPLSRSDWGSEHGDQGCAGRGRGTHQGSAR